MAVGVGAIVGVGVAVGVGATVGVGVAVGVGAMVGVGVAVGVGAMVGVGVAVGVGAMVGVDERVGVIGVAVGGAGPEAHAAAALASGSASIATQRDALIALRQTPSAFAAILPSAAREGRLTNPASAL